MVISSEFVRRCGFPVCNDLQQLVYLADGSTAWTEGTVSNVELDFNIPPKLVLSGRGTDFDIGCYKIRACRLIMALMRFNESKSTHPMLAQNLHVMSKLPHDIILSGPFIFSHQIYTTFRGHFIAQELDNTGLEDIFQVKAKEDSWRHKLKSKICSWNSKFTCNAYPSFLC